MVAVVVIEERVSVAVATGTIVLDCYCPVCRAGYLGSVRFATSAMPPRNTVHHRGRCDRCRKWRWRDVCDGIPRTDGESGQR